jgi:hypothetical protein
MTNKEKRQSTRKVKNLKVKSLSANKAKRVKGGYGSGIYRKDK